MDGQNYYTTTKIFVDYSLTPDPSPVRTGEGSGVRALDQANFFSQKSPWPCASRIGLCVCVIALLAWSLPNINLAQRSIIPLQVFGTDFTFQQIASGLSSPVAITNAKDGSGRLFITLQGGQIMIYNGTQVLATPFLSIAALISCCGERGLLSVAFHPNYTSNGFFYVYYTNTNGDLVIARYRVSANPNIADPNSASIVLTIPRNPAYGNHNGGQLQFGPDGYLYIGPGDGGGGGDPDHNGQNLNSLLGKILRIDVNNGSPYGIPPTNPFVDGNPNTRDEIWAYGVRNPWRFSFDRLTGDLFIADVGQSNWEEVDFQTAGSAGGQNYGWNTMEGNHCYPPSTPSCNMSGLTLPILEYSHSFGCSITGGYRYRGSRIPELYGKYLYSDYCSGRIWGATFNGSTWTTTELADTTYSVTTFGEDEAGEIYFNDYAAGVIYRIVRVTTAALLTVHRSSGNVYADGAYFCGLGTPGPVTPPAAPCFNAGLGADVAERIDSLEFLESGDVVEIDPDHSGYFRKSRGTPLVVGVVSTRAGLTMANRAAQPDFRPSIALIGRVPVKATRENGPIQLGDLLTPSSKPGYAMRCHSPCMTPILGKALGTLNPREGLVMMLVMRP